jgi:hypothetical protein
MQYPRVLSLGFLDIFSVMASADPQSAFPRFSDREARCAAACSAGTPFLRLTLPIRYICRTRGWECRSAEAFGGLTTGVCGNKDESH